MSLMSKIVVLLLLIAGICGSMVVGDSALALTADTLHVQSVSHYALNTAGKIQRRFLISNSTQTARVTVQTSVRGLMGTLRCDGDVKQALEAQPFEIPSGAGLKIDFPTSVKSCVLSLSERNSVLKGAVQLVRESDVFPMLSDLNKARMNCPYDSSKLRDSVDSLFLTNSLTSFTCAQAAEKIEPLESSESGFLAKMEALTGSPLASDFIKNQNPYAYIDMSRAPKLDAIFVASLVFRHDFYGTVLTRLLRYHAERGTLVNVITTGYMQSDKDRELLYSTAREVPNFRLQEYDYQDPRKGLKTPMSYVDAKYRDMHIKMFVTLSSQNPASNILVMGGRNVHDGFLFDTKPDHSRFPELTQYGTEENFVHWSDFEIKITSSELAKSIYEHLLKFKNREDITNKMESINVLQNSDPAIAADEVLKSSKPLMRHIISVPFNDGQSLEKLYVKMIDSAQKEIQLSSPYLRPTKAIAEAMERAVKRKVKLTIQTRINLEGDTMPWLYTEVNKESINKFLDKAEIYEWTKNSILHSKFLLIDGKLAFVGSVNLSRRSFIQDIENGFVIRSPEFVARMQGIFNGYTSQSHLITEEQSRKFWGTLMVSIFKDQF